MYGYIRFLAFKEILAQNFSLQGLKVLCKKVKATISVGFHIKVTASMSKNNKRNEYNDFNDYKLLQ